MSTIVIIHNKHRNVTVEIQDRVADDTAGNWLHVGTVLIGAGELSEVHCSSLRRLIITENET
jgi:hypothetical protein